LSTTVAIELPQSDEAERSVLGAILVDNKRLDEVADLVRPEDFYRTAHQRIFRTMLEMSDSSLPIDLLTLAERHQNDGALEGVGGVTYLSRLMDGIPRLVNVRHYASIVRERSIRRQLVRTANELATDAALGETDIEQMLGEAERRIFAIAEKRMAPGFLAMKELLARSLDDIEKRQQHAGQIMGVPTGFTEFDELTSGFQNGDLIILAARPSMGKTAWALSAAQNAAIRADKKVAIFSLEMSAVQLAMRILCSEARVDAQKMRRGQLNDRHWAKLIQAYGRLATAPMFIDETSGISVTEMRAKVRRLAADRGLDMIVVDYLQLIGSSGRSENRQQEISAISRSLKEMARELNVPVLALSQLSRAPDQRQGDHRPMLSDLRESGSLEQDADVVAFIYREEIYRIREGKDPGDKKGIAEIIIGKQRNGPVDTVKLAFIKEWTRFENLQRDGGEAASAEPGPEGEAEAEADDGVTPF
jgi:replicative DNA helicase